jgi:hypothetical protein
MSKYPRQSQGLQVVSRLKWQFGFRNAQLDFILHGDSLQKPQSHSSVKGKGASARWYGAWLVCTRTAATRVNASSGMLVGVIMTSDVALIPNTLTQSCS